MVSFYDAAKAGRDSGSEANRWSSALIPKTYFVYD